MLTGLIVFSIGVGLLTWCAKVERKELEKMRDPQAKWAFIDGDSQSMRILKVRAIRGIALTAVGLICSIYGFIKFISNIG